MRDYIQGPAQSIGSLAGFSTLRPADTILLGAPLIDLGSATDHALEARCSDLRTAIVRLQTFPLTIGRFFFVPSSVHGNFYIPLDVHTAMATPF